MATINLLIDSLLFGFHSRHYSKLEKIVYTFMYEHMYFNQLIYYEGDQCINGYCDPQVHSNLQSTEYFTLLKANLCPQ